MSKVDSYVHLNSEDKIRLEIDEIASQIGTMNYGVHRMLSALVRQGKQRRELYWDDEDNILKDIEKLLNEGKI